MDIIRNIKCNLYVAVGLLMVLVTCVGILYKCNLLGLCETWFFVGCTIVIIALVLDIALCFIALRIYSKKHI